LVKFFEIPKSLSLFGFLRPNKTIFKDLYVITYETLSFVPPATSQNIINAIHDTFRKATIYDLFNGLKTIQSMIHFSFVL
jgi:hypothetical protein